MEPTHAWHLPDPALRSPWLGCVLTQRKMCPGPVVVVYASPIRGLERSPWAPGRHPTRPDPWLDFFYLGQIQPVPLGLGKQPTDCGRSCFGSHSTTSGDSTVKAMGTKKTTERGNDRNIARENGTPTNFEAIRSDSP